MLARLLGSDFGATALEYGLTAGLILLACLIAFLSLGLDLTALINMATAALA